MTLVIIGTLAVSVLFVGIGKGLKHIRPTEPYGLAAPLGWLIGGWGAASVVAVFCALTGLGLLLPYCFLCALGLFGLIIRPTNGMINLAAAWLIVAPLLIIASAIPPIMFDEFAQWLPNSRFIIEHGRFPDVAHPNIWSFKPAYPPGLPVVGYFLHGIVGPDWGIGVKIFAALLASSFGLVLAECLRKTTGTMIAVATGTMLATALNPFFDPRIALTANSDAATGFVLGYLVFISWRAAEAGEFDPIGLSLTAALLTLLRETNIVLIVGLTLGLFLTNRQGRMAALAIIASAGAAFMLWRWYINFAEMLPAMAPRSFAEWRWDAPSKVLQSLILERLANNKLLGLSSFLLLIAVGCVPLLRKGTLYPLQNLMKISVPILTLWVLFLSWSYVAVFNDDEISQAASTWRYLSQLGPLLLLILFVIIGGSTGELSTWSRRSYAELLVAGVIAIIPGAVFILGQSYWDLRQRYPGANTFSAVAQLVPAKLDKVAILHSRDALGYAIQFDYVRHNPAGHSKFFSIEQAVGKENYLLDIRDIEIGSCPTLSRWQQSGWVVEQPDGLANLCRTKN